MLKDALLSVIRRKLWGFIGLIALVTLGFALVFHARMTLKEKQANKNRTFTQSPRTVPNVDAAKLRQENQRLTEQIARYQEKIKELLAEKERVFEEYQENIRAVEQIVAEERHHQQQDEAALQQVSERNNDLTRLIANRTKQSLATIESRTIRREIDAINRHAHDLRLYYEQSVVVDTPKVRFICSRYRDILKNWRRRAGKKIFLQDTIAVLIQKLEALKSSYEIELTTIERKYNQELRLLQAELSYQEKALDILRTRLTRQDTVQEIASLHIDKLKTYWKKQEADITDQLLFCNQAVRRAESQKLSNEVTLVVQQVPKSMAFDDQLEKISTSEKKMISNVSAGDFFAADEKAEEIKGWISKLKQEISAPPPPSTFANILLAGGVFHQFGRKPIASFGDDAFLYNETFINQMPLLAEIITRYPGYHVFVDGHIDPASNNGDSYANTSLSKQRVLAAVKQIRAYGIPEDKLTLDWFGEFHNLVSGRPASPELRKNNRVDLVIMNASDTASFAERYVRFKNQFRISLPNGQSKTFYHKNGFWIEKGYDELAHPLLAIYYAGQAYQTMRSRHDVFRVLTEEKPSPLFSGGKTYLGNQFRASFEIAGEIFNVEISEFGVKSVADIHQSNVRQFLGAASSAKP